MAIETSVIDTSLRVARVVHEFAKKKGWESESYRIFMTINTDWYLTSILVVSDHLKGLDDAEELEMYDDLMDDFEISLKDDPELYRSISLAFWPLSMYGFQARPRSKDGEVEIPDSLLNPGVEDWRGPFRTTTANPGCP